MPLQLPWIFSLVCNLTTYTYNRTAIWLQASSLYNYLQDLYQSQDALIIVRVLNVIVAVEVVRILCNTRDDRKLAGLTARLSSSATI